MAGGTNFLALCMWLALSGLLMSGCESSEKPVDIQAILSRVHDGDERQQTLKVLSDAWYHSECRYPDGAVQDIFLYGPKNRDEVTIVAVFFEPQGGQLIFDRAGIYENYFLDAPDYFDRCKPSLQDAFERNTALETKTP